MKPVSFGRPAASLLSIGALVLALAGCKDAEVVDSSYAIEQFITGVSTSDGSVQATLQSGDAPTAGGGGAPTVGGIAAVVNGGSAEIGVSSTSFTRMIVAMQNARGYYELTLPAGVTAQNIILNVSTAAAGAQLRLLYATGSAGDVTQYAPQSLRLIRVGTGDVR